MRCHGTAIVAHRHGERHDWTNIEEHAIYSSRGVWELWFNIHLFKNVFGHFTSFLSPLSFSLGFSSFARV
jgi:hypothetical protein